MERVLCGKKKIDVSEDAGFTFVTTCDGVSLKSIILWNVDILFFAIKNTNASWQNARLRIILKF